MKTIIVTVRRHSVIPHRKNVCCDCCAATGGNGKLTAGSGKCSGNVESVFHQPIHIFQLKSVFIRMHFPVRPNVRFESANAKWI